MKDAIPQPRQDHEKQSNGRHCLLHHLGCGLVVIAFVHFFGLYQLINEKLGKGFIAVSPFLLPILLLTALFLARKITTRQWPTPKPGPVLLGLCCCFCALALPDPEIAVKRIHVMEYLLLSLYVRYALSSRLAGTPLLVFSCLLAGLYGVHDELLQGLHPARTYGLRDMSVNAVAAFGGCLLWHGLAIFSRNPPVHKSENGSFSPGQACYLAGLAISIPAMAVPLFVQRNESLPFWPFLPLAAATIVWSCFFIDDRSAHRHGILAVSIAAFLFLAYPLAVNVLEITFY